MDIHDSRELNCNQAHQNGSMTISINSQVMSEEERQRYVNFLRELEAMEKEEEQVAEAEAMLAEIGHLIEVIS